MASGKYYAVRKGKTTGIYRTWEECRASVEGVPGAVYKSFKTLSEAEAFLGGVCLKKPAPKRKAALKESAEKESVTVSLPQEGCLLAYVDGSYDHSLKKYAFGCVFILPDGRVLAEYGNGDNEQSLQHRNVTGEMLGAMYAVRFAMRNGFSALELCYDYQGIEKWATGEWRSRTELTGKYAKAMREWGKDISITFTKVAAHTNVYYNEMADRMAKTGLVEGNGVPAVHDLEDSGEWNKSE
ncbi:MAG: ribonuclease H family protein [Acetatifactor sp.]|nr:ribonuclease H family protein [Acetatifactor sp.]